MVRHKYHCREIMPLSRQKKRWYLGQLGYSKKISGFKVRPGLPRQDVHFSCLAKLVTTETLGVPIPFDIVHERSRTRLAEDSLSHHDRYKNFRIFWALCQEEWLCAMILCCLFSVRPRQCTCSMFSFCAVTGACLRAPVEPRPSAHEESIVVRIG